MKSWFLLFILLFLSISCTNTSPQVCFDEKCVNVEIADEKEEITTGLMFRESLAKDSGMLFVFPEEGVHKFWMKNTLIPLDMIWINDNEIIYIKDNALPCKTEVCESYGPDKEAKYVLEVNSGFVEENEVDVGDTVKILV